MRIGSALLAAAAGLMLATSVRGFDIGLVPLHEFSEQEGKPYGQNISLQGSSRQVEKMRRWFEQIALVPRGYQTLVAIQQSGHKLIIFNSHRSVVSSGKASAPMTSNLINGVGESIDIFFSFDIPDSGSHWVFDRHHTKIEYSAIVNLYHELAHAMHMMNGTWAYAESELQAIQEENVFRRQLAKMNHRPYLERVYVSGAPVCPETLDQLDESWQQGIICF